jgi:hypothetical protein
LASRIALLNDGPQRRFDERIGMGGDLDRLSSALDRLSSALADITPMVTGTILTRSTASTAAIRSK